MASFTGTAGNDTQNGTNNADTFDYSQGGKDTLDGKGGIDTFSMGAQLAATDSINGGNGTDTVVLNGDYSGLIFGAATLINVEILQLTAGHDYTLTLDNSNVTIGQGMTIDASALGAADAFMFDGSDESSSALTILCGAGINTIFGGGGDDVINGGANFTAASVINGGTGRDRLELNGDYGAAVFFTADTIRNIDRIKVDAGNDYTLVLHNGNLDFGDALTVDGSALGAADSLIVAGGDISEGRLMLIGGAGGDALAIGQSGEDVVKAGEGNDTIFAGANLMETVRLNGGDGSDTLTLSGDYSDRLELLSRTIRGVETMSFGAGADDYYLVTNDGNIASGATLTVDGSGLLAGQSLRFDGSGETNGALAFIGGGGTNVLTGAGGNDTFDMSLGGSNTLTADGGDDTFFMGAAMTASAGIDGGSGNDTVTMAGDYSGGLVIGAAAMVDVETLILGAGFDYTLALQGAILTAEQVLTIDLTALTALDAMHVNAGGAGGTFAFLVSGDFKAGDTLVGGSSVDDSIVFDGDYSSGLDLGEAIISNIENVFLTAGNSYNLTLEDGNVGDGGMLFINGSALGAADVFWFDGVEETDAHLTVVGGEGDDIFLGSGTAASSNSLHGGNGDDQIYGGEGADSLDGGDNNDYVDASLGGADFVFGGTGDDQLFFGGALSSADFIGGGDGTDSLTLDGLYSPGGFLPTMPGIETVIFAAGHSYHFVLTPADPIAYDASALGAAHAAELDGSVCAVALSLTGGAGADTLRGGDANDTIMGGGGNDFIYGSAATDTVNGGSGNDRFTYDDVSKSTGVGCDILVAVNFNQDVFKLAGGPPAAIDGSVGNGTLSTATFDADMATKIDASRLGADHAVLWTPSAGTLAGHKFLIVDANGIGGYQAGADYVFEVTGSSGSLDTGDFI